MAAPRGHLSHHGDLEGTHGSTLGQPPCYRDPKGTCCSPHNTMGTAMGPIAGPQGNLMWHPSHHRD